MDILKKKKKEDSILEIIKKKYRVKRYIELVIGILLVATSFNLFLLPNNLVFGGVSGLSIIIKEIIPINPSQFIFIASVILLIVSYFTLGKEKTKGSILGSILFPIFVELTANVTQLIPINSNEMLLAVIFGGVLSGIGSGLVFKAGFTTGGTDIINQIISKYGHTSMGNAMLMSDGLIVLGSVFIFGVTKLMYAIIVVYIMGFITDKVLLGISASKAFYIVTKKEDDIKDYVLNVLGHGVTIFDTKGGYTNEKQQLLLCVVPTNDYYKFKEGIHEIDKDSFFVVTDAYEVIGGE